MSSLDVRQLAIGKDGRLFIEIDGENIFLEEVDTFTLNMTVNSVDYQPVGDITSYGVPTGASYTLTYTEAVVRDDVNMKQIVESLRDGKFPYYTFQGALIAPDNEEQRVVCRRCLPSGEFNLMNLTPGDIVKRNQSYRVNQVPEFIKTLATREFTG